MILLTFIFVILTSYLLGSINTSIILSKFVFRQDIRDSGSGNAGATNMLRTYGKKAGIYTLIGDMFKGVIAVLIAVLIQKIFEWNTVPEDIYSNLTASAVFIFDRPVNINEVLYLIPVFPYAAGLFVMIGHIFPVFFKFKGGKGVATAAAVILSLNWKIGLAVLVIALILMAVTRYVSLGSVIGAASYPFITLGILISGYSYKNLIHFIFALLVSVLCILKHSANIKRLLNGQESKLGEKKSQ